MGWWIAMLPMGMDRKEKVLEVDDGSQKYLCRLG